MAPKVGQNAPPTLKPLAPAKPATALPPASTPPQQPATPLGTVVGVFQSSRVGKELAGFGTTWKKAQNAVAGGTRSDFSALLATDAKAISAPAFLKADQTALFARAVTDAKLGKTFAAPAGLTATQTKAFTKAVTDATKIKSVVLPPGLTAEDAKKLVDAAKEVAGRNAATHAFFSGSLVKARVAASEPEGMLAMQQTTSKLVNQGSVAAEKYLTHYTDPATAKLLADQMASSRGAATYLGHNLQTTVAMKWVSGVAHGVTGLTTLYDLRRLDQLWKDAPGGSGLLHPSTWSREQWWAAVAVAGDAAMFVPFPPVQLAGSLLAGVGGAYRDSPHPVHDFLDWFAANGPTRSPTSAVQ